MRSRSISPMMQHSPVRLSRASASATTRSRPPKGRSGCARTSRHHGSGLGCTGRREAKRIRGCAGRLCSSLAPLPRDPNSGCGLDQRAAKHRAPRHRSEARHSGQCSAAPSRSALRDGGVSANNSVFPWRSPAITSFRTDCPRENGAQGGGSRYLSMLYALAPASESKFLNISPQAEVSNANTAKMQPRARMHRRRTTLSSLASPRQPKPIPIAGRSATSRNG